MKEKHNTRKQDGQRVMVQFDAVAASLPRQMAA
jgi:hypothetical protein